MSGYLRITTKMKVDVSSQAIVPQKTIVYGIDSFAVANLEKARDVTGLFH